MPRAVFVPQQTPRDAFAPQLAHHQGVVGPRLDARAPCMRRALIQTPLQLHIRQRRIRRPAQPGRSMTLEHALHRRARHPQRTRDLALAEPLGKVQAKYFTDLSHQQSRLSHGNPAGKTREDDSPQLRARWLPINRNVGFS